MNKWGWKEGDLALAVSSANLSEGSVIMLNRDDNTSSPWWTVVKGRHTTNKHRNKLKGNFEDCCNYINVIKLSGYFRDISSPTQQEIDMFNMLHGTELTREDLCQGQ